MKQNYTRSIEFYFMATATFLFIVVLPLKVFAQTAKDSNKQVQIFVAPVQAHDKPTSIITPQSINNPLKIITTRNLLPVTGFILNGQLINGFPKLNWNTKTEANSIYFVVESSADSVAFIGSGRIAAAGNSNILANYSFYDNAPPEGTVVYYRIKAVGRESAFSYSNIITVLINLNFKVFPNPASDILNIQTQADGAFLVELLRIDGKMVQSARLTCVDGVPLRLNLNRGTVIKGMYSIRITNTDSSQKASSAYGTVMIK